nr:exodeoxyribonuclease I-like [Nerophis lumbriciformis]
MSTIYWHDYETFGISPQKDRPVQFAGRRTDVDLNPVGDPLSIHCQQTGDYLPQPMAALVTGITPQRAEEGLREADFAREIHQVLAQPNTCGAGYNSIRFDDEVTRYLLFRNFYDPYQREYQSGNSRWDLIDVVRLCYALRPEGINWPIKDNGNPSFRLEDLTAANGIEHSDAHDALADVDATIALAQLIRQHQPRLFDHAYRNRGKHAVSAQLKLDSPRALLHVSSRYPASRGCLAMVLPICGHPTNPNAVLAVDLAKSPEKLLTLSSDDIADRIFTPSADLPAGVSRIGVKAIAINRSPMLAPLGVLKGVNLERIALDPDACLKHQDELLPHIAVVGQRLQEVYGAVQSFPDIDNADWSLYSGGFASNRDRALCNDVRQAPPATLAEMGDAFEDSRFTELLFIYRARNWPETLSPQDTTRWQDHCHRRLLKGQPTAVQQFEQALWQARKSPMAEQRQGVLDELEDYVRLVLQAAGASEYL